MTSSIIHMISDMTYDIRYMFSSIRHMISDTWHQVSDIWYQTWHMISSKWHQVSDIWYQTWHMILTPDTHYLNQIYDIDICHWKIKYTYEIMHMTPIIRHQTHYIWHMTLTHDIDTRHWLTDLSLRSVVIYSHYP